ncbi:hypothetical protein QCA50_005483 [Cerrena zonata]|uniref:Uncharacterized protein n=1 Tax=Cerrena zonata TaxID=2478898 RepID=A0AAW0GHC8_9APHY
MIVSALAKAPKLRVVKTELPTVWNEALLQISSNSSLAEIQLSNSCQPPQTPRFRMLPSDRSECQRPTSAVPSRLPLSSILPISSLYMRIAKNHTRLMDLIHAGSEIVTSDSAFFREPRQRAWTIIPSSPIASGHSQSTSKVTCPKDEEAEQTENESGGSQSSNTRLGVRREVRKGERRMSAV